MVLLEWKCHGILTYNDMSFIFLLWAVVISKLLYLLFWVYTPLPLKPDLESHLNQTFHLELLGLENFVESTSDVAKHYAQVTTYSKSLRLQCATCLSAVRASVLAQLCGKTRYLFPTYPGSPSENGFMEPKYLALWRLRRTPLAHHLTFGEPGSLGLVSPALPISVGELPWKQYIQIVSYNIMGNPKKQTHFIGNLHSSPYPPNQSCGQWICHRPLNDDSPNTIPKPSKTRTEIQTKSINILHTFIHCCL